MKRAMGSVLLVYARWPTEIAKQEQLNSVCSVIAVAQLLCL